jgi:protein CpxP
MTTRFLTAGALAASLTFGGAAFAQGPGGAARGGRLGAPGGAAFAFAVPVRELNLTDAQQDQIRDIVRQHRDEMQQAQTRLRDAREAQRKAIQALPVNEGAIRAITTQQVADAEADAAILQARVHSEVWAVLTPDQQAQAAKLQADRDTRIEKRQQRRQNRRAPRQ